MVLRNILFDSGSTFDPSRPSFNLKAQFVDRFKILTVQIPNSFYPVSSHNNQIAFKEGADTKFVRIPAGFYNTVSAPEAIEVALNSVSDNNYVVTYSDTSRGLTISGDAPFQILDATKGTTAFNVIGTRKVGDSPVGTQVSLGVANFSGTTSVILTSSQLTSQDNMYAGNEHINVLAMIPLNAPNGAMVTWTNPSSFVNFGTNLPWVEYRLLDSATLLPIDLNGQSFQIQLAILTDSDDVVSIV